MAVRPGLHRTMSAFVPSRTTPGDTTVGVASRPSDTFNAAASARGGLSGRFSIATCIEPAARGAAPADARPSADLPSPLLGSSNCLAMSVQAAIAKKATTTWVR